MNILNRLTFSITLIAAGVSAYAQNGPGGVGTSSSMAFWLNADSSGVSNGNPVATWPDLSGNGNDFTQGTGSAQPTMITGHQNGHAAVDFDGSADFMDSPSISALNNRHVTWIVVAEPDNAHVGRIINSSFTSGGGSNSNIMWGTGVSTDSRYWIWSVRNTSGAVGTVSRSGISGAAIVGGKVRVLADKLFGYKDGTDGQHTNAIASNPTGHQFTRIGAQSSTASNFFDGKILEAIAFEPTLEEAERKIVENHLSSKYGIPISFDYYVFEGTHPAQVIGVGGVGTNDHRDSQMGTILRLYNPSLPTESYLMVGHDNGSLTTTTAGLPASVDARLVRTWRADITGNISNVSIDIDATGFHFGNASGSDYVLLIDDDGDFSNGGTREHYTGLSFNATTDVVTFTNVTFTDGEHFTLARRSDAIFSVQSGPWQFTTTWNCSCVPTNTDSAFIQNSHTVTISSSSNAQIGSLTIQSGGTLFFNGTTTLQVDGDLDVFGSIDRGQSTITFAGSNNHILSNHASDTLKLFKLSLNATSATLNVDSGLILIEDNFTFAGTGGTLNKTNAASSELIFGSDINKTAYLYQVPSGASITGSFYTFQRFMNNRTYNWMDLASPAGTTLRDWDARPDLITTEIYMSGVGGVDGDACCPIWNSVYTYDPVLQTYNPVTSVATPLLPGGGFEMWMADGPAPGSLNNFTFDSRGTPNSGSFDVSASLNKNGTGSWTLLGNPYPATINFKNVTKSGVKNEVWVFDASISNYTLLSSNPVRLAPFQGFYVESTSATNSLTFQETDKTFVSSSTIYSVDENLVNQDFALKLQSTFTQQGCFTYFRLHEDASANYEAEYDAGFLRGKDTKSPKMYTVTNAKETGVFGFSEKHIKIPMIIEVTTPGDYKISLHDPSEVAASNYTCGLIRDKHTGDVYNILYNGEIEMNLSAGTHKFELELSNDIICDDNSKNSTTEIISMVETETQFAVEVGDAFENTSVSDVVLVNTQGQRVKATIQVTNGRIVVEKAGLRPGIYLLSVGNGAQRVTQKLTLVNQF